MHRRPNAYRLHCTSFGFEALEPRRVLATFTVVNTDDSGGGSLRQAIVDANAAPGADQIAFDIPGDGPHTITPGATAGIPTGLGSLPTITDPVTIDGYTQPGAIANSNGPSQGTNARLAIELDGSFAGSANGLNITAGGSTIRGLVINRFIADLINLQSGDGNRIEGNFLGTNVSGTATFPLRTPGRGVVILGGSQSNIIGTNDDGDGTRRNLISGSFIAGVGIGADANVVAGNLIGTDATGAVPLNLTGQGVILQIASNNRIGTNGNGAGDAWERNVISGNSLGVGIGYPSEGNLVAGNVIGADVSGIEPLGNVHGVAIGIGAHNNQVGGEQAALGNVIAFNSGVGVGVLGRRANVNGVPFGDPASLGPSTGIRIQRNSIHSNARLGIDLDARQYFTYANPSQPNHIGDDQTDNNLLGRSFRYR